MKDRISITSGDIPVTGKRVSLATTSDSNVRVEFEDGTALDVRCRCVDDGDGYVDAWLETTFGGVA